jgi:hypothetical protein
MKNTLNRSEQDNTGQWWYVQPRGTRQRARIEQCKTCGDDYITFPRGSNGYCSTTCYRKPCKKCGKEFNPRTNRQVYCSAVCKQGDAICKNCGKHFVVSKKALGIFCSTECHYLFLCPIGTVRDAGSGYKIIKVPKGTPNAKKYGPVEGHWMLEHRWVMQQKLGRPLGPKENVHHINGKRDDNRPENLELWKRSQPSGVRAADYHCAGCNCFKHDHK